MSTERYLPAVGGYAFEVDTSSEPIVKRKFRIIGAWTMAVRGRKVGADVWMEHDVRDFKSKEDAVLIHDLLMEGKIGWKEALTAKIDRETKGGIILPPA